jgi:hypothetical protein
LAPERGILVINLPIIIAIQALSENPLRPLIFWAG